MSEYNARPYVLSETNWKSVRETEFQIAVLPWGATEAHNYHLPYGTDNYQAEYIAAESARIAWSSGARTIVFPCIPFGVNTGQMDIRFCSNLNPSTQFQILQDIATVVVSSGVRKLVLVNGHGGNDFKQMLRELTLTHPDLFACSLNWYEAVDGSEFFEEPGDHAGEMETSCMMHIAPGLLRPLNEAGTGAARSFRIEGLKQGWVKAQRAWSQVTDDTGVGNPQQANPEKGNAFLECLCGRIGSFLVDLSRADVDDLYE